MVVTDNLPETREFRDDDLVRALRSGDANVFREIVEDLNPGLTRMAQTYVTAALAEEVVQETWASVVRKLDTFEGRSSLKTWIYRIMLNKVRTLAGREARIVPFAALGRSASEGSELVEAARLNDPLEGAGFWSRPPQSWRELPGDQLESAELLMMILDAIEALPAAQREVVELRDLQGWRPDDVCEALGISSANQRVLLHRGRSAVRGMLEEYLAT